VEVYDEEGFVGGYFLAAFVFLAFDAAVASCEFGAERVGYLGNVPEGFGRSNSRISIWKEWGEGRRMVRKREVW